MCNNAVDNNPSTIKDVPDWCNAQELCDKAADDYSIALDFFPDWCKSEEMCEKIISENLLCWWSCWWFSTNITFFPDWFVTSKMIKNPFTGLYGDKNAFYLDKNFRNVV